MLASELRKKKVYAYRMNSIGKVDDIVIDLNSRSVTHLVVKVSKSGAKQALDGRLRIRSAKVRVPVSEIDRVGDAVALEFTVNQMRKHVEEE